MLGKLIEVQQERDAIHVAILPAVAGAKLAPGQDVGILEDTTVGPCGKPIGIVDPFLKSLVFPGQRFFICIYPETVTGMRHHWELPAVDVVKHTRNESAAWLNTFAHRAGMTCEEMIERVSEFVQSGFPWVEDNSERARNAFYELSEADRVLFWEHFENCTDMKRPESEFDYELVPFSCSC